MIRFRRVDREAALAMLFGALAVAGLAFLFFAGGDDPSSENGPFTGPAGVTGEIVARDRILSSGGYNTFAGAWIMPRSGAVATAFVNVKGPAAPPCESVDVPRGCSNRGFRGADHHVVVLESTDNGQTWSRAFADERVTNAPPHAYSGQPYFGLRADGDATPPGTLLRRVNGEDISTRVRGIPRTAYLQRRAPGDKRWTGMQVLLDAARYTYNLSRVKRLSDGRTLVATGGFWPLKAGTRLAMRPQDVPPAEWLLMTSTDEGITWHNAMSVPRASKLAAPANEWDVAELPGGDLLAVMRTRHKGRPARKQVVLERTSDTITTNTGERSDGGWVMGMPILTTDDFAQIRSPQHPELLNIDHGPAAGGILHVADEAIHYTADGGVSWSRVSFPSDWTPHYYPNSVQAAGGNIYVFSHAGSDENYTTGADKPVYVDIIRLVPDRDAQPL